MSSKDRQKAPRYTTELLNVPGMSFDITTKDPKARIQKYIDAYRHTEPGTHKGIDESLMRNHIRLVDAQRTIDGCTATFTMKNHPEFSNRMGNMHGGAVAMIHDMCTTMCAAPLAREGFWVFGGVSRNLSITFLRPVTADTELIIESEVLQQGERLATIKGVMKDKASGKILSVAEHNKASINFEGGPSKSQL